MFVRCLYTLIWLFVLPFALARLVWKGRKQPAYLRRIRERFGRYRRRIPGQVIWLHAVSLGETRAAEPLVRAMLARWPEHTVLLTHMTPTGRAAAKTMFAGETRVRRVYLPYDLPWFGARFLRHFRPAFGVIMETELWPNLLIGCRKRGVPVLLANARLSSRSAQRYARLPGFSRMTFSALAAVGAQTEEDARRLAALGAPSPAVVGNVKFDFAPPPTLLELGRTFREGFAARKTILAASTREGEEALLLEAFARHAPDGALLILVPRHPERFDEVAGLINARSLKMQRRSSNERIAADTQVWLGDSMGELFAYYAAADVALIGGSLLPFGGQNPIEACAVGVPVLLGPHTFHFEWVAERAVESGAALRVSDAEAALRVASDLLTDADRRVAMARAGRNFVAEHQGATARTLALIEKMTETLSEVS